MVWGAIAGAVIGGVLSSRAAGKASDAQMAATEEGIEEQRRQFDLNRADLAPGRRAGYGALNEMLAMMGIQPMTAEGNVYNPQTEQRRNQLTADIERIEERLDSAGTGGNAEWDGRFNPGDYEGMSYSQMRDAARRDWMQRRNALGIGGMPDEQRNRLTNRLNELRGELEGLNEPGQDVWTTQGGPNVGDSEPYDITQTPGYQFRLNQGQNALTNQLAASGLRLSGRAVKEAQRFGQGLASQEFGNRFNRLASIAGAGQSAVNTGVAAGQNAAGNISSLLTQGGNAAAAGVIGRNNAWQNALQNGLYAYNRWGDQQRYNALMTAGSGYEGGGIY